MEKMMRRKNSMGDCYVTKGLAQLFNGGYYLILNVPIDIEYGFFIFVQPFCLLQSIMDLATSQVFLFSFFTCLDPRSLNAGLDSTLDSPCICLTNPSFSKQEKTSANS